MPPLKKPTNVPEIGDVVIYANKWRDLVVGLPKINGHPGVMVQPLDGREALMASDSLKDMHWISGMIAAGVFTLVKCPDNVDPTTGEIINLQREIDMVSLQVAFKFAERRLEEAKAKHGDEDLSNFRDEWELHRRLRSALLEIKRL